MTFSVGSYQLSAVLDIGCEASILSTQLYNELRSNGVEILELPTQNVVLVGAFSRKTHRVKKQGFMTLKFGNLCTEQVFLVSDQLLTPMLIGCDFCIANGFERRSGPRNLRREGFSRKVGQLRPCTPYNYH